MRVPSGVVVPMVTPIQNGDVAIPTLEEFTTRLVEKGVDGLFPCGSIGEFPSLTTAQRTQVVESVVRQSGDVPVFAGCGDTNVRGVLEHIENAHAAGADIAVVVSPYYLPATQDGLVDFYTSIADSSRLPILLYNIPQRTGCTFTIDTVVDLASHNTIVGLKDSSGDITYHRDLIDATPDTFAVFQGPTQLAVAGLDVDATGLVAGPANLFPEKLVELYSAYTRGDRTRAVEYHSSVVHPLVSAMTGIPTPAGLKYLLSLDGIDVGPPLPPLSPLGNSKRRSLEHCHNSIREADPTKT